jgi:hypothetical protein
LRGSTGAVTVLHTHNRRLDWGCKPEPQKFPSPKIMNTLNNRFNSCRAESSGDAGRSVGWQKDVS